MYFFFFFYFIGESATHYLVKNTVKTFKELGVNFSLTVSGVLRWILHVHGAFVIVLQVLKERKEDKVTTLELSSTFIPQANRNKLLQYILGFSLL